MTDLPPVLIDYMTQRRAARAREREALLEPLTEKERRLFREGAVIGFVQGTRYSGLRHDAEIPLDDEIVTMALDGCITFPDCYPIITGYQPPEPDPDDE